MITYRYIVYEVGIFHPVRDFNHCSGHGVAGLTLLHKTPPWWGKTLLLRFVQDVVSTCLVFGIASNHSSCWVIENWHVSIAVRYEVNACVSQLCYMFYLVLKRRISKLLYLLEIVNLKIVDGSRYRHFLSRCTRECLIFGISSFKMINNSSSRYRSWRDLLWPLIYTVRGMISKYISKHRIATFSSILADPFLWVGFIDGLAFFSVNPAVKLSTRCRSTRYIILRTPGTDIQNKPVMRTRYTVSITLFCKRAKNGRPVHHPAWDDQYRP